MNPAAMLSSIMSSSGNALGSREYTLLDSGDTNANVKMIGDRIVEKIKTEYIDKNPNDTPEKIKAQVKNDLLKIYYTDSGNRVVRPTILQRFCDTWYSALKVRNETIIKELMHYMKTHTKQNDLQSEDKDISEDKSENEDKSEDIEPIRDITMVALALPFLEKDSEPKPPLSRIEDFGPQLEDDESKSVASASSKTYPLSSVASINNFFTENPLLKKGGGMLDLVKNKVAGFAKNANISSIGDAAKLAGTALGNMEKMPELMSNIKIDEFKNKDGSINIDALKGKATEVATKFNLPTDMIDSITPEMINSLSGPAGIGALGPAAAGLGLSSVTGTSSLETEKKQDILLEKLIEYKVKLFETENFKKSKPFERSATVSQVHGMHEKLITKILCNYAAIDRNILMEELRKIILGEDVMKEIEEYQRKRKWIKRKPNPKEDTLDSDAPRSIYHLFMDRLDLLSDIQEYHSLSEKLVRIEEDEPSQTGGTAPEQIPQYIPSTYVWEKIKNYVETQIQVAIRYKLVLNKENTEAIQSGFKDVFLQSNCDSLNLESTKNTQMTEYFNNEYHALLNALCSNIPVDYATRILSNYILRNFTDLSEFLNTVLSTDISQLETYLLSYFKYNSVIPKILENPSIQPEYPELERTTSLDAMHKYDSMDECCNDRKADTGLDSYGVSEFLKVENIEKDQSMADNITPSVLLPAFEIYKEEFNQCTENLEFLKVLFDMYSGRSIKFMHHVRAQFENDSTNDFIERYIITKHTYTTKMITECIKHAADIKITLQRNFRKDEDEDEDEEQNQQDNAELTQNLSYYTAFLLYISSDTDKLKYIEHNSRFPYIDFIKSRVEEDETQTKMDRRKYVVDYIKDGTDNKQVTDSILSIINGIPEHEQANYNSSLKTVLFANKQSIMSRFTRKRMGNNSNKRKTANNRNASGNATKDSSDNNSEPLSNVSELASIGTAVLSRH